MKLRIVLTTAALTLLLILARPQTEWAQSTTINAPSNQSIESQKKPREANEYDQNEIMGMYFAVMCELSSANGETDAALADANKALELNANYIDALALPKSD